jgi:hypothetical protein
VREDLDNVAEIAPLDAKLGRLAQLVADSRLTWLAEAYEPSLAVYGVAKVRAKKDGSLSDLLEPMAEVFATRRARAKKAPAAAPGK